MEKKYELTEEVDTSYGFNLYRIRALKDFGDVKKGDLGGWIEKEENLSQEGDCWVYDNAMVSGAAKVSENAKVINNAKVSGVASAYGHAVIGLNATVKGHAAIHDYATVTGFAKISGNVTFFNSITANGHSIICGDVTLRGRLVIKQDAVIESAADYLLIGPMGSRNDTTFFYKTRTGIAIECGCFSGTLPEFQKAVAEKYRGHLYGHQYFQAITYVRKMLDIREHK